MIRDIVERHLKQATKKSGDVRDSWRNAALKKVWLNVLRVSLLTRIFFFFFGKEEANLKANVVTIITNLLNGGSYNSFDKFWTQHAWGRLAGIDTPSRQTAADLMIEIGAVIDSLNLSCLQVINFLMFVCLSTYCNDFEG